MKLLKTKTYNRMLDTIERGVEYNGNLRTINNNQHKEISQLKHEIEDQSIKSVVVGRAGIGKTTFVKKKLLRGLKNYLVIDTTNEYQDLPFKNVVSVVFGANFKQEIISIIENNKDKTIIVDNSSLFGIDFHWLERPLRDVNYIFVASSKRLIENHFRLFKVMYEFKTTDEFRNLNIYNKIVTIKKFR